MNIQNWKYYYNLEGDEWVRANLVYTPYISPDGKTFCMDFNRSLDYHKYSEENILWNDALLTERFNREIEFHSRAATTIPTLKIIDIDEIDRKIFIEWHGNDFLMQGKLFDGYNNVLPQWKDQWLERINQMWDLDILKFSLHPNSWVAKEGTLIPFNWFFSFDLKEKPITIRSLLIQISLGRQEKLSKVLETFNMDLDTEYNIKDLQILCFNSFRENYPAELIDQIISMHREKSWR